MHHATRHLITVIIAGSESPPGEFEIPCRVIMERPVISYGSPRMMPRDKLSVVQIIYMAQLVAEPKGKRHP